MKRWARQSSTDPPAARPARWHLDARLNRLKGLLPGCGTGDDLWTLSTTGDREPAVFLQTPYNEASGVFSPGGQWIAYHSDVSGRQEVYVRPFPAREGHESLVSREGGTPRWRGDGQEIFFLSLEVTMMAAAFDPARQQAAVAHWTCRSATASGGSRPDRPPACLTPW